MRYKKVTMSPAELRKLQLIQADMLSEFDRVCRKNNIKYILDAGTLLGAVRYGKFIPWDDDIDIRMLRSEYEKFCEIAAKELNKSIFFQSYKTDKNYPWLYSKLRKRGTKAVRLGQEKLHMHNGVFIDIFPCDGVPTNKSLCTLRSCVGTICRKILYSRVGRNSAKTALKRTFWELVSLIPMSVPHKIAGLISVLFDEKHSNLVGCLGWHGSQDNIGYKKEWFTDLTAIQFEGKEYLAPKDYDGFLRYSFGDDYMTPPPAEQRTGSAFLSSYDLGDEVVSV